jgi:hypothetical protein
MNTITFTPITIENDHQAAIANWLDILQNPPLDKITVPMLERLTPHDSIVDAIISWEGMLFPSEDGNKKLKQIIYNRKSVLTMDAVKTLLVTTATYAAIPIFFTKSEETSSLGKPKRSTIIFGFLSSIK